MNHLKTFEAFFDPDGKSNSQLDKDLFKVIGANRHTIEDILIDIQDKVPDLHISISLRHMLSKNQYTTIDKIVLRDGKWINLKFVNDWDYSYPLEAVKLYIDICPSGKMIEELKNKEIVGRDKWYNFVLGDINLDEELETLKKRLELLGFLDVKIKKRIGTDIYSFHPKTNLRIVSTDQTLPKWNMDHGIAIASITAHKEVKLP